MRKGLVIFTLVLIFTAIASLFWYNEWKYSLPTPVPKDYHSVNRGDIINLEGKLSMGNKPLLLHFYNPGCPCSRFNIPHVAALVKEYNNKIDFAIVVMNKDSNYTAEEIQDKFGLTVPVLFDKTIAAACGVYSTPQAAILTTDHKLYYRGNYNKSRYCTEKNSDYARMALDSLVNNKSTPVFNKLATVSYGCTLPVCKK